MFKHTITAGTSLPSAGVGGPRNVGRIDSLQYGKNQIGQPIYVGTGTYVRIDIYTSFKDSHPIRERRFAAGSTDFSRLFTPWDGNSNGDAYYSGCSCCWLGFSHTFDEHHKQVTSEANPHA